MREHSSLKGKIGVLIVGIRARSVEGTFEPIPAPQLVRCLLVCAPEEVSIKAEDMLGL
jgi:hypothetical protein